MPRSHRKTADKPLSAAGLSQYFERALLRQCGNTPEQRLCAAVIAQAFRDTQGRNEEVADLGCGDWEVGSRVDAARFFVDGRMEMFADMAGIPVEYVRSLCKSGYQYAANNAEVDLAA